MFVTNFDDVVESENTADEASIDFTAAEVAQVPSLSRRLLRSEIVTLLQQIDDAEAVEAMRQNVADNGRRPEVAQIIKARLDDLTDDGDSVETDSYDNDGYADKYPNHLSLTDDPEAVDKVQVAALNGADDAHPDLHLDSVESPSALLRLIDAEKAGGSRTTALKAIEARLSELEPSSQDDTDDSDDNDDNEVEQDLTDLTDGVGENPTVATDGGNDEDTEDIDFDSGDKEMIAQYMADGYSPEEAKQEVVDMFY